MSEAIYDEQIAPLLMEAGKLCEQHGLAMVAVVEYGKEQRGETRLLPDGSGLAMHMLSMLAASGNNIDSYLINVIRFCNREGIPLDESMFLRQYGTAQRAAQAGARDPLKCADCGYPETSWCSCPDSPMNTKPGTKERTDAIEAAKGQLWP